MPDSYLNAIERMRDSSRLLHGSKQFHNACYLGGYVVECYLKILHSLSSLQRPAGRGRGAYGHNIQALNADLVYALTSSTATARMRQYLLDISIECASILATWNPNYRYDDGTIGWNEPTSNAFQSELEKCYEKVIKMLVDAVITH